MIGTCSEGEPKPQRKLIDSAPRTITGVPLKLVLAKYSPLHGRSRVAPPELIGDTTGTLTATGVGSAGAATTITRPAKSVYARDTQPSTPSTVSTRSHVPAAFCPVTVNAAFCDSAVMMA